MLIKKSQLLLRLVWSDQATLKFMLWFWYIQLWTSHLGWLLGKVYPTL